VRVRDGAILGNTPFKETWTAGDGTEKLKLEKEGFRSESLVVPLDHGLSFNVELTAASAPAAPVAAAPTPAHVKPGKHHHGAAPGPTPPAAPSGGAASPPPPPPKPATPEEPVPL
jgi:hypothetical protein